MSLKSIQSVEQLILDVSKRLSMFGVHDDLEPTGMFIQGFAAGRGEDFYDELEKFQEWLFQEAYELYQLPRNYSWWWLVQQIYQNATVAAQELPNIYRCFKEGKKLKTIKR